ncbi:methyltransferase domain-containing protein [Pseudoxanthomonas sp. LjRoot143]|uniref:methyltransferase domain-containing protein n=1 Tax=Pseudoxanthomonas sp. LjRoot143 TaxID=3342266 RepID=UPI003ECEF472
MNRQIEAVQALVARLPEVYQPVYGYPELSGQASRATQDRLEDIRQVYRALSNQLGRPLRVLDLGCAQGYLSFSLAELGASVVGVEMLTENAELCRKLASLNPHLDVNFVEGRIEDYVASLEGGRFDIVLLLSVIHHVAFHVSPEAASETVTRLRSCAPVLLAELAVAEEPLYWAAALPADPASMFGDALFLREIRHTGTHLSDVTRPLFFVSDAYWFVAGEVGEIQHARRGGHRFAKRSFRHSRTYLLSDDRVLKVLSIQGEDADVNRKELEGEVAFLRDVEGDGAYPRIIAVDEDSRSLFLVREKIDGQLLIDAIDAGQPFDSYLVVKDILAECIALERRGLYHQDIRVWNVLARGEGRFCLIDYGAISPIKSDCFWPQNIYIAFLIFVRELLSAPQILVGPIREIGVTPHGFPGNWSHWVAGLAKRPLPDWNFEQMLEVLQTAFEDRGGAAIEPQSAHEALLKMLEESVTVVARTQNEAACRASEDNAHTAGLVRVETERVSNLHNDLLGLLREHGSLKDEQGALRQAVTDQQALFAQVGQRIGHVDEQLEALRGLAAAGRTDAHSLQAQLSQAVGQLRSIEERLGQLEARTEENFSTMLASHQQMARELSEVRARVFRRGFWDRLFTK